MSDNPRCPACGRHNAILPTGSLAKDSKCRDCGADWLEAEISILPRVFRLRGFPGQYFRASKVSSYYDDSGVPTIYLEVATGPTTWASHSKGTLREILRELIEASGDRKFDTDADVERFLHGEQPDQAIPVIPLHDAMEFSRIGARLIVYRLSKVEDLTEAQSAMLRSAALLLDSAGIPGCVHRDPNGEVYCFLDARSHGRCEAHTPEEG